MKLKSSYKDRNNFLLTCFVLLFFLGGFTSLVYQVAWQRVLTQVIGVDSYSVTLIVGLFMVGLGFGGLIGSRLVDHQTNTPLILALLQFIMGVFGIISVPLIRNYNEIIGGNFGFSSALFFNFFLLLIPTLLMGMTTPLMVHVFRNNYSTGRATSLAYSTNVLGASTGALIAGFVLLGTLGLRATCQLVGLMDLLIGCSLYLLSRKQHMGDPKPSLTVITKAIRSLFNQTLVLRAKKNTRILVLASFMVGFVALSYEITYFRLFTSYFGVTSYVFPILLFAYLVNMGVGTFLAGYLLTRFKEETLFFLFITLGLLSTFPILYLQAYFLKIGYIQGELVFNSSLTIIEHNLPVMFKAVGLSLLLMLPITFISGIFPLFVNIRPEGPEKAGTAFGKMYFYQTLGNTLGAISTGFILYRFLETVQILKVLGVTLVIAGTVFMLYRSSSLFRHKTVSLCLCLVTLTLIPILGYNNSYYDSIHYYRSSTETAPPELVKDTLHGMSLVYDKTGEDTNFTILAGGRFHVTSFVGKEADTHDSFTYGTGGTEWIYAINPNVRDALYVGLGTASEILASYQMFPDIDLDVVEINPDVVTIIREMGSAPIVRDIDRSNVYLMDGRRFLMHYSKRQYDWVHIGVDRATTSGAGNLFSRDFFQTVHDRLSPQGLISFQSYPSAVKAALEVFPETMVLRPSDGTGFAIASKDASVFSGNWTERLSVNLQNGLKLISQKQGNVLLQSLFREWEKGILLRNQELWKTLKQIPSASDDFLVTEFYLNQRNEIHPGVWDNSRPRDMRIIEPVPGVQLLSKGGWIQKDNILEVGKEIYHWRGDQAEVDLSFVEGKEVYRWSRDTSSQLDLASVLRHSGGFEDQYDINPSKAGIQILPRKQELEKHTTRNKIGLQWNVRFQPNFGGRFFTYVIIADKQGRGQWGGTLACKDKENQWQSKRIVTEETGSQGLTLMLPVANTDSNSCLFTINYDLLQDVDSRQSLTLKKILIYEHPNKDSLPDILFRHDDFISTLLRQSGGLKGQHKMFFVPNGARIKIPHKDWFISEIIGEKSLQWNVPFSPPSTGQYFTFTVLANKQGRGQWGVGISYQNKNGFWESKTVKTALRGHSTLPITLYVPDKTNEVHFVIKFNDSRGMGLQTDLTVEDIRVVSRSQY